LPPFAISPAPPFLFLFVPLLSVVPLQTKRKFTKKSVFFPPLSLPHIETRQFFVFYTLSPLPRSLILVTPPLIPRDGFFCPKKCNLFTFGFPGTSSERSAFFSYLYPSSFPPDRSACFKVASPHIPPRIRVFPFPPSPARPELGGIGIGPCSEKASLASLFPPCFF